VSAQPREFATPRKVGSGTRTEQGGRRIRQRAGQTPCSLGLELLLKWTRRSSSWGMEGGFCSPPCWWRSACGSDPDRGDTRFQEIAERGEAYVPRRSRRYCASTSGVWRAGTCL